MNNKDNYTKGAEFEQLVLNWFTDKYKKPFNARVSIPIGSPLLDVSQYKLHKFDIVSDDRSVVIECKCYTWTKSFKRPSGKITELRVAAQDLSYISSLCKKYIVMLKSYNPKLNETLAEHFFRECAHCLGDIIIAEYDLDTKDMKFFQNRYSI